MPCAMNENEVSHTVCPAPSFRTRHYFQSGQLRNSGVQEWRLWGKCGRDESPLQVAESCAPRPQYGTRGIRYRRPLLPRCRQCERKVLIAPLQAMSWSNIDLSEFWCSAAGLNSLKFSKSVKSDSATCDRTVAI